MGCIIPNMGMDASSKTKAFDPTEKIADALFTKVQQRVLGVLFGNPGRSFYANELIALAGCGTGAVHRELARLKGANLLTASRIGNQKHYQANPQAPVYEELRGLILKTSGLADVIRTTLSPFASQISMAWVFGSVAKGKDVPTSDIDLMVISDTLAYADIFPAMDLAGKRLGRTVNPTVYSRHEFESRLKRGSAFVKRVSSQPKLWLIGGEGDLPA